MRTKKFSCGAVVPGCTAKFEAKTESDLMKMVAEHARDDHGMTQIPDEIVEKVRANIHE